MEVKADSFLESKNFSKVIKQSDLRLIARITSGVQAPSYYIMSFPRVQRLKFRQKIECYRCLRGRYSTDNTKL